MFYKPVRFRTENGPFSECRELGHSSTNNTSPHHTPLAKGLAKTTALTPPLLPLDSPLNIPPSAHQFATKPSNPPPQNTAKPQKTHAKHNNNNPIITQSRVPRRKDTRNEEGDSDSKTLLDEEIKTAYPLSRKLLPHHPQILCQTEEAV